MGRISDRYGDRAGHPRLGRAEEKQGQMSGTIQAYPLQWPATWLRTKHREIAPFLVSETKARQHLMRELRLLGASQVVISSNVELRLDGLPRANQRIPDDPGVAVYFRLNGEDRCVPCDRWRSVYDNLRAIGLTIAALRGIERWGAHGMVDAAFTGFAALPAGDTTGEAWWDVLKVSRHINPEDLRATYLMLVKETHPDNGGDPQRFHAVQLAYEQARKVVAS